MIIKCKIENPTGYGNAIIYVNSDYIISYMYNTRVLHLSNGDTYTIASAEEYEFVDRLLNSTDKPCS